MKAYPCRASACASFVAVVLALPSAGVAGPIGGSGFNGRAVSGGSYVGGTAYARGGAHLGSGAHAGAGARGPFLARFDGARGVGYGSYVISPAYASAGSPPYIHGGYGHAPYGYGGRGSVQRGAYTGAYSGNAVRVLDGDGASLAQGNGPLPYAPPTVYRIADRDGRGDGPRVSGRGTGFHGGDPSLPRIITVRP